MVGTCTYIFTILTLRRKMMMSSLSVLYQVTMAMLHCVLWVAAISIYLGVVGEEQETTPLLFIDEDDVGQLKLRKKMDKKDV